MTTEPAQRTGSDQVRVPGPANTLVRPQPSSSPYNLPAAPTAQGALHTVCVLHGNPTLAPWLFEVAAAGPVHLVINDPGPGRYATLPGQATVHVNDTPAGFAGNVNAAVARLFHAHPDADRVVLVNFDLQVPHGALERLAAALDEHPTAALIGAALSGENGQPTHSVGRAPSLLGETTRALGLRSGRFLQIQRAILRRLKGDWADRNAAVDNAKVLDEGQYLPWACVVVRRSAWEQVGGLDEQFYMYCEDVDWGRRAHAADWQQVLVNVGSVVHSERATASAATNAMFEQSNMLLHSKYGQDRLTTAIRLCLLLRRWTPLRFLTVPLDWSRFRA